MTELEKQLLRLTDIILKAFDINRVKVEKFLSNCECCEYEE